MRRPAGFRLHAAALVAFCVLLGSTNVFAGARLQTIRARGHLVCGVNPGFAGFATVDAAGRYSGFDIDMCRAVATAIFGSPDRVRFVVASSVQAFLASNDIDIVSRRLTWTLEREGSRLLFGPVSFFDGQAGEVADIDRVEDRLDVDIVTLGIFANGSEANGPLDVRPGFIEEELGQRPVLLPGGEPEVFPLVGNVPTMTWA